MTFVPCGQGSDLKSKVAAASRRPSLTSQLQAASSRNWVPVIPGACSTHQPRKLWGLLLLIFDYLRRSPTLELLGFCVSNTVWCRHLGAREALGGEWPSKAAGNITFNLVPALADARLRCTHLLLPEFFRPHRCLPGAPYCSLSSGFHQARLPRLSDTSLNPPLNRVQVLFPSL